MLGPVERAPAIAVKALRRQIADSPAGTYLGSEADLLVQLGVSSPTLRQAARLLEQQQLLTVERGARGGYFGRRPNAGATSRAAALYLEAAGTPLTQVQATVRPLMIEVARLAARSLDRERRSAFRRTLEEFQALTEGADCEQLLLRDRALVRQILRLAGNPAIELFVLVIYHIGRLNAPRSKLFRERPDLAETWRRHTLKLGAAILDAELELSGLYARRGMDLHEGWLSGFEPATRRGPRPTGLGRATASLAEATADALRDLVLSKPPGAFIGGEEELARRLKVSRHTLRQAASMARYDGLLEIRRGVSGGYVGRRPDIDQVVEAVALYLEFNDGTLLHLMSAAQSLAADACRHAARSSDPDFEARLEAARDEMSAVEATGSPLASRALLRAEQHLMETVLDLSGNRATELFVLSLYRFGGSIDQPVSEGPDRVALWKRARLRLIEVLLERDGEAAAVVCGRVGRLLQDWLC